MKSSLLFALMAISSIACSQARLTCNDLPQKFDSYIDATSQVEHADFKFTDEVEPDQSSWIYSANYYSCDGQYGFMIYTTRSRKYIHANMPKSVWMSFKNASSLGSFYNTNIKGRYRLLPE